MSTFFNDIKGAMRAHLAAMTGAPPISWENVSFDENAKELYLRADFLPSETVQACFGDSGQDLHNGVFQVSIFVPNNDGDPAIDDEIADHFRRGLVLTQNGVNVRIQNTSVASPLKDENFFIVPVEIRYQAFTSART